MGRPVRDPIQIRRDRLRTRALLHEMSILKDVENPNQFAELVAERTGTFQEAAKWRSNFKGERCLSPQQVQLLTQLDPDVIRLWEDGPWGLWRALWGDPLRDDFQGRVRIRWSDGEPGLPDDQEPLEVVFGLLEERTHAECLMALERVATSANSRQERLPGQYLVEAVLLFRLGTVRNTLTFVGSDCYQAYRCIRLCLENPGVWNVLLALGIEQDVLSEIITLEFDRLVSDDRYRKAKQLPCDVDRLLDFSSYGRLACEDRWGRKSNVSLEAVKKLLEIY